MLKHIPFESLYTASHGWLESHFHFSFAEYRNKNNINYGSLRVMNDDYIKAKSGFGTHPHRDMEIITYVISGELTHQDSMHNKETLGRGAIQYLSAGSGITHSEMNDSEDEVHLIQTWILPEKNALTPQYGSKMFSLEERKNRWLHLVGPKKSDSHINIYQDASMYVSEIDDKQKLVFDLQDNRQLYVKLLEGSANMNGILFEAGDAAEVSDEKLNIEAIENTHVLLVEMKKEMK